MSQALHCHSQFPHLFSSDLIPDLVCLPFPAATTLLGLNVVTHIIHKFITSVAWNKHQQTVSCLRHCMLYKHVSKRKRGRIWHLKQSVHFLSSAALPEQYPGNGRLCLSNTVILYTQDLTLRHFQHCLSTQQPWVYFCQNEWRFLRRGNVSLCRSPKESRSP